MDLQFRISGAPLKTALELATLEHKTVIGYKEERVKQQEDRGYDTDRLILFWQPCDVAFPLPSLKGEAIFGFVTSWLNSIAYPLKDELFDGSYVKGSLVYNEQWGRIGDMYQAFVAIEPYWEEYGK